MFKVAILVDLELSPKSGGHVKFWENICYSIKNQKDCLITFFFLGKKTLFLFDLNPYFFVILFNLPHLSTSVL